LIGSGSTGGNQDISNNVEEYVIFATPRGLMFLESVQKGML